METVADVASAALASDINNLSLVIIGITIISITYASWLFSRIFTRQQNAQSDLLENNAQMVQNLISQQTVLQEQSKALQKLVDETRQTRRETKELFEDDRAERTAMVKSITQKAQDETIKKLDEIADRVVRDINPIATAINALEITIRENLTIIRTEVGAIELAVVSTLEKYYNECKEIEAPKAQTNEAKNE